MGVKNVEKFGFEDEGRVFYFDSPKTPSRWSNTVFNDNFYAEIDQCLQGKSYVVNGFTREAFSMGYRFFYINDRDTGEVFCPNYYPLKSGYKEYRCEHGLTYTKLISVKNELKSVMTVGAHENKPVELTSWEIFNLSGEDKNIDVLYAYGLYDHGVMGGDCCYDNDSNAIIKYSFPYHALYEDKEKVEGKDAYSFVVASKIPDGTEMSTRRLFGGDDISEVPVVFEKGGCSNIKAEAEQYTAAFLYNFLLKPGEKAVVSFVAGRAHSREEIIKSHNGFSDEICALNINEAELRFENRCSEFMIDTADKNLDAYINYWLKKQVMLQSTQNRGSIYCPIRNQLQDSLGYALVEPEKAVEMLLGLLKRQRSNGSVQQWYMTDGSPAKALCFLNHTDGPIWLIICLIEAISFTGDYRLFEREVLYEDGTKGTVFEHLVRASEYKYRERGIHGLCLMGDGDWNDPMNGVGREGKGESVWNTEALLFADRLILQKLKKYLSEDKKRELETEVESLKKALRTEGYKGGRFLAAYDDNGNALGDKDTDGKLFLNTQTWGIMSGMTEKEMVCDYKENMNTLFTPFGPRLLNEPFMEWNASWGRVSIKKAGTTENGSVYCHASAFKAYADGCIGDAEGMYDTIIRTLPTNVENGPLRNLQFPGYIANYYYALQGSENYGRSSCHYETGTVAWLLYTVYNMMLGIKNMDDGIRLEPVIPVSLGDIRAKLRYGSTEYTITYRKSDVDKLIVDGKEFMGECLPVSDGCSISVEYLYR